MRRSTRFDAEGIAIDILVNNAGIQLRKPMVELATDEWRRVIDANLTSAFVIGREAAKRMIPRGRGKIINIGSLTSELARATVAPYTVAKGGIKMLTRAMAAEWAAHGIQANAIGPGYMLTDMNQALVENADLRRLGQGPHAVAALGQAGGAGWRGGLPGFGCVRLRQRPDHLCRRRHAGGALKLNPASIDTESNSVGEGRNPMRGVIIHAPKDLRIEEVAAVPPGPREVRVGIEAGGICGSDLHYYHHGGFGTVRLQQPMALGHEIAGTVAEVGSRGSGICRAGMRVAVNPSQPCGACRYCRAGRRNQCLDMRFMGSAMRVPHVQGGFRQSVTVDGRPGDPDRRRRMTMAEAAMAEPLAVCLHAARQAPARSSGARVLVTGCGPIGALAIVVARLRRRSARSSPRT